jgi:hypothetical protein
MSFRLFGLCSEPVVLEDDALEFSDSSLDAIVAYCARPIRQRDSTSGVKEELKRKFLRFRFAKARLRPTRALPLLLFKFDLIFERDLSQGSPEP